MPQTSGNNSSLIKTELDEVYFGTVDRGQEPQEVMANDPIFFKQESANKGAVIFKEMSGARIYKKTVEQEANQEETPKSANKKTVEIAEYTDGVYIPKVFYDDDQFSSVQEIIRQFGSKAKLTRDKFAFENSYGDAFAATTADGAALCSNSHLTPNGDTIDNLETAALSPDGLETIIKSLRLQKDMVGDLGGQVPRGLLVPLDLHFDAVEFTESTLKPEKTDNNINATRELYVSQRYSPGMVVGTSAYLDSTFNTKNSNADTSYFLVSANHSVTRWEREALNTNLRGWAEDGENRRRYYYQASFREEVAPKSWVGLVGSNGTA
jgi:hypothetical protein